MFGDIRHVVGEFAVAVGFEVGAVVVLVAVSLSVFCPLHGRCVGEYQKLVTAVLFGFFHEVHLACALRPVVARAVLCQERLRPALVGLYVRAVLFERSAADVEPPHGKPDAFGISVRPEFLREQPLRNLPALFLGEVFADEISAPRVCRREVVYRLEGFFGIYSNRQSSGECKRSRACGEPNHQCISHIHTRLYVPPAPEGVNTIAQVKQLNC